ncbi:hypothetical protein KY363_08285, partial [Candidatus Woesearchaeota archaeon]|nr:hypothetical protein [Candidatus Woesearchaeota archaeon]
MALYIDISKLRVKEYSTLKAKLTKIKSRPVPDFEKYTEDIKALEQVMSKYTKYDNLIVIGNGGSNTSFKAFHTALVPMDDKKRMFILTTMEPDLINSLYKVFPKRTTLVMPISKSGTTIGLLESMFAFNGYRMLPVTSPDEGALSVIAKKEGFDMIPHPKIGGRYSGVTASGYAPALFFGIDVQGIDNGAKSMYKQCAPTVPIEKNPALQLAAALYILDQKGYTEIFCPIYSSRLLGFQTLITQLIHESCCKNGRGQTVLCAEAPESQHHTNQRFFGGKKNIVGVFLTVSSQDDMQSKVVVPDSVKKISVREGKVGDINGVPYAKSLSFEFQGTYQDA